MSPAPAAPKIASMSAWLRTSPSEWPRGPLPNGTSTPASTSGRPVDEAVEIVAAADARAEAKVPPGGVRDLREWSL